MILFKKLRDKKLVNGIMLIDFNISWSYIHKASYIRKAGHTYVKRDSLYTSMRALNMRAIVKAGFLALKRFSLQNKSKMITKTVLSILLVVECGR